MPFVKRYANYASQLGGIVRLMSRRKESSEWKLKLESETGTEWRAEIKKAGGQEAVGKKAKINQSAVSRVTNGEPTTVDTLMRLQEAVPGLPPALVMTKGRRHADWCRLGAYLIEKAPEQFIQALGHAANLARLSGISDDEWTDLPPQNAAPELIPQLKSVIANPLRTDRKRGVRRG